MKWLLRSFIIASVLCVAIFTLFFTHTGNVFLWDKAQVWIPELSGNLTDGHLGKGWTFKKLAWKGTQLSFQAEHITIAWHLASLLQGRLWITAIEAESPSIILAATEGADGNTDTETAENKGDFSLPIDIDIDQVNVTDFHLSHGHLTVSFVELTTACALDSKGLVIKKTVLDSLTIVAGEQHQEALPATSAQGIKEPVQLPNIKLPFPISISQFLLVNTRYEKEVVPSIGFSIEGQEHNIIIHSIDVEHPLGNGRLSGKITLQNDYPLNIVIDSTLTEAPVGVLPASQHLRVALSGSLDELETVIDAKGAINAGITGTVHPIKQQPSFDLKLIWQSLQWPLVSDHADIESENGEFTIVGDISSYQLNLNTKLTADQQPSVDVTLAGTGSSHSLNIDQALVKSTEGSVTVKGVLDWTQSVVWNGQVELLNFNPSLWLPELSGELSGTVKNSFSFTDKEWSLYIPEFSIIGRLREQPVKVSGEVRADSRMYVSVNTLELVVGDNSIITNGRMSDEWAITSIINNRRLEQLCPGLKGSLAGKIEITGSQQHPSVAYSFDSPLLSWQQFMVSELHAVGVLAKHAEYVGKTQLNVQTLQNSTVALKNIELNVAGSESNHQLSLSSEGVPAAANLNIVGSWQDGRWQGSVNKARIVSEIGKWTLQKPLAITLDRQQTLSLSEQCWLSEKASLCLEPATINRDHGQLAFKLKEFDLNALAVFFPEHFVWQAKLFAQGKLQWKNAIPVLSLHLSTPAGTLQAAGVQSRYESLDLTVDIAEQTWMSNFSFLSKQLGQANVQLSVTDILKTRTLAGDVNIEQVMLNILTPFVPKARQITGTLSAKGRLGGFLAQPLFYGDLSLNQGGLETARDIISISQLKTIMTVNGSSGVINGRMNVGKGVLTLAGNLDWQQLPLTGKITARGRDIYAQYPGVGAINIQPDLTLILGKEQSLTGTLTIPWAKIKIYQLPTQAITRSDDVIIITPDSVGDEKQALAASMNINIHFILEEDIKLDAFGLKTALKGKIDVKQVPSKPLEVQGSIQLIEGKYRYLGQNLIIQEGQLIFSGPPDNPYLDVKAIRNSEAIEDNVIVGVQAGGPVSHPEWSLFSKPSMPQSEQFSYLLRGRATDSSVDDDAALQSMLVGLGVSQLGGFVTEVGSAVGIEDLTLDTKGSGDNTQVTVSGYVSQKTQVEYGVGVFNSVGEVRIKYELISQLYLQATTGLAQALDIFYRFSF